MHILTTRNSELAIRPTDGFCYIRCHQMYQRSNLQLFLKTILAMHFPKSQNLRGCDCCLNYCQFYSFVAPFSAHPLTNFACTDTILTSTSMNFEIPSHPSILAAGIHDLNIYQTLLFSLWAAPLQNDAKWRWLCH